MTEEEPEEPKEQEPEEQEQQEEQEQEQEDQPVHSCGGKLQKGMKFCPACGEPVDTDAYK